MSSEKQQKSHCTEVSYIKKIIYESTIVFQKQTPPQQRPAFALVHLLRVAIPFNLV